jgi:uncharacterized membrane protein YoaK (UPF0700 family)
MQRWHLIMRDTLVVLLTLTTGVVDAASFLGLGNVFSSVITGNMVLLGVAAGIGSSALAVHAGVALAGYSAGVMVGAPFAARREGSFRAWPRSVTVALALELLVLAIFSVGWELAGGHPSGDGKFPLIVLLAAAMGMQSAAVRQLGQMSSTYLTSTLTGLLAGLVTRTKVDGAPRSVGVLAAIVAGAVAGSLVTRRAPAWLPAVALLPLAMVVTLAAAGFASVTDQRPAERER